MGGIEVYYYWWITQLLALAITSILTVFSYKNLLLRFSILKKARKDYYECGFRPHIQKPIQVSNQFILIIIFFIIYDIELAFSFPLIASGFSNSLQDILGFLLIYGTMFLSLFFDFDRNLLNWKFI